MDNVSKYRAALDLILPTVEKPALYFTVLGEPTLKMLRYQRQFTFFDAELAGSAIQFVNLSAEVMDRDLGEPLQRIVSEVERLLDDRSRLNLPRRRVRDRLEGSPGRIRAGQADGGLHRPEN